MNRYAFVALASLALCVGCERKADNNPPPDNTKINERDRQKTLTPLDQGNSQADLDTTQRIRQALMQDDTLSTDAKNIKVITNNGVITLRGPVKNEIERVNVVNIVRGLASANRVDNQLEVPPTAGRSGPASP